MATEKSAPDVVAWTSAFQCDFFCFYQQFVVISMLMLFIVNSSLLLFILFLMLMLLVVGVLFSSRLCSDGSNCSLPVSSTDEGGGDVMRSPILNLLTWADARQSTQTARQCE